MSTSFLDLGVSARMVDALSASGITEAFPVQAITLPDALAGKDLCGRAPTGSGKTLGFGIPMMMRVSQAEPTRPTGLVLVPTRELADQVQRAFVPLGRASWRFVQAVYGGSPMSAQIHSLRKGASVVVATPGRLLDLIEQGHCDLGAIEVLVIDEADRMADLGFMPDVRKILEMTPTSRQTMLWSATLDGDVNELINDFLNNPVRHDLVGEIEQGNVEHRFVVTPAMDRIDATVELMSEGLPTVIFVKTRFGVDDVTAALMNAGIKAGSLHGARTQQARQRTLDDFKRGKVQALVATDVAARGIHVDNVDLVVHYDLPDNDKDYLHRSGRTGRAGHDGKVVAFVPPSRVRVAKRLISTLEAEVVWVDSSPIDRTDRPARPPRPSYAERAARTDRPDYGDRPSYGDRPNRVSSDRGGYQGRSERPAGDRPGYQGRTERPAFASRSDRPTGDRPGYQGRTDRPSSDRPGYQGRTDSRPSYGDRPTGDRPGYQGRTDRPTSGRPGYQGHSDSRPSYGDRPTGDRPGYQGRTDRPTSGRPGYQGHSDSRPSYGDRPTGDRPGYQGRTDRPTSGRPGYQGHSDSRPNYGDRPTGDRPGYQGRTDRPTSGRPGYQGRSDSRPNYGDRPAYQGRTDRPTGDRPGYQGRSDRNAPAGRPTYGDRDRNAGDRSTTGARTGYQGRDERPAVGRPSSQGPTGRPGAAGGFRRPAGR